MTAVTVVVTTFQRIDYLKLALDSLVGQTFEDFEALICDNANDPQVGQLVAAFHDERLHYLPRPENLGLMRNAIEGFKAARTEFVTKLDDDDVFEPQFLERTVTALQADPSATIAFTDRILVGPKGEPLTPLQQSFTQSRRAFDGGTYRPCVAMALNGIMCLNAAVLRRNAVDWDAIPEATATAFDFHILLDAAGDEAAAVYIREPLVHYRMHPGADTSQRLVRQGYGRVASVENMLARSAKTYDTHELQQDLTECRIQLVRELLREGSNLQALRLLGAVLRDSFRPELTRLALLALLPPRLAKRVAGMRKREWARREGLEDVLQTTSVTAS